MSQLQWVVDAYTLVFAGLLLLAGTLGDRYGRRRSLLLGLATFGVASAAAAFAGGGVALGPVVGGFLLDHFWWGSVFIVNVPIVATAMIAARVLVPESRS